MSSYSQSGVKAFKRCPLKYRYRYVDNIIPKKKAVKPSFGTLFHNIAAAMHIWDGLKRKSLKSPPVVALRDSQEQKHLVVIDAASPLTSVIERVVDRYKEVFWDKLWGDIQEEFDAEYEDDFLAHASNLAWEWHKEMLDGVTPVYVEHKVNRGQFSGVIDLVYEHLDGHYGLVQRDYKTVNAYLDENRKNSSATDIQHIIYGLLLPEAIGMYEYVYVSTNMPTIMPRRIKSGKLAAKPGFFNLRTFENWVVQEQPEPEEMQAVKKGFVDDKRFFDVVSTQVTSDLRWNTVGDVLATLNHIAHSEKMGDWTRTLMQSCSWDCSYRSLCTNDLYGYDTSLLKKDYYEKA